MIRKFEEKDRKHVEKLLQLHFHTSFPQENPFIRWFIFEINHEIKGFICYSIMYDQLDLNYIYVDMTKRKQGIASELMKCMINDALTEGVVMMTLEVHEDNLPAQALYKKFNFEVGAIRKNYYGSSNGLLMIRKLM